MVFTSSKPTVWDGDEPAGPRRNAPFETVLSPLCGMETHLQKLNLKAKSLVLSPLRGMETTLVLRKVLFVQMFQAHRVGWRRNFFNF